MNEVVNQTKYGQTKAVNFTKRSIKFWLEDNDMDMYSAITEGKSVFNGRFIKTLQNKIYKYVTSISKYMYIDKLDHMTKQYINTYQHN